MVACHHFEYTSLSIRWYRAAGFHPPRGCQGQPNPVYANQGRCPGGFSRIRIGILSGLNYLPAISAAFLSSAAAKSATVILPVRTSGLCFWISAQTSGWVELSAQNT